MEKEHWDWISYRIVQSINLGHSVLNSNSMSDFFNSFEMPRRIASKIFFDLKMKDFLQHWNFFFIFKTFNTMQITLVDFMTSKLMLFLFSFFFFAKITQRLKARNNCLCFLLFKLFYTKHLIIYYKLFIILA